MLTTVKWGRIVIAGEVTSAADRDCSVARYNREETIYISSLDIQSHRYDKKRRFTSFGVVEVSLLAQFRAGFIFV